VDNNTNLDPLGYAPFGTVVSGMDTTVMKITTQYGQEPDQDLITRQGNAYLNKEFPKLDYIKTATIAK
jgi:peptidyl-prolyl cis-trans isomerase A (cyclophilin A)